MLDLKVCPSYYKQDLRSDINLSLSQSSNLDLLPIMNENQAVINLNFMSCRLERLEEKDIRE